MINSINDGGPAFPCDFNMSTFEHGIKGMFLRDWFAGQALAGLVFHNDFGMRSDEDIAAGAYSYADAMIAARNKEVAP